MKSHLKLFYKGFCFFCLALLIMGCPKEDQDQKISNSLDLERSNIHTIFPEFIISIEQKDVVYFQVLQILDSLGSRKVKVGLLACCINLKSENRERIYGGELHVNGISIPFNGQNFYSKWYDDTLSSESFLKDSINWEIEGNGPIKYNNATTIVPLPRPYKIKDLPEVIIKENSYVFDSVIYYTGDVQSDLIYKSSSNLFQSQANPYAFTNVTNYGDSYEARGNPLTFLKPGLCFINGFIYRATSSPFTYNVTLAFRILEYKKIITVK